MCAEADAVSVRNGDERDRQRPTDLRLRAEGALLANPRRPSLTGEPKELALAA